MTLVRARRGLLGVVFGLGLGLGLESPALAEDRSPFSLLRDAGEEKRMEGGRILCDRGVAAVPACVAELEKRDLPDAARAILLRVVGRTKDPRGFAPVLAHLGHASAEVRAAAAFGLADIGNPEAVPQLERLARDDKEQLEPRRRATLALERIGPAAAAPTLTLLIQDPDWVIRGAAARGVVAGVKAPVPAESVARLEEALEDERPSIRLEAVGVLMGIADPATAKTVIRVARADARVEVRAAATAALGAFADPATAAAIVGAIAGDPALEVRRQAALAAARRDLAGAVEPLIGVLTETDTRFKRAIQGVLKELTGEDLPPSHLAWNTWWVQEGRARFAR